MCCPHYFKAKFLDKRTTQPDFQQTRACWIVFQLGSLHSGNAEDQLRTKFVVIVPTAGSGSVNRFPRVHT